MHKLSSGRLLSKYIEQGKKQKRRVGGGGQQMLKVERKLGQ
jgi:hypothetical protein